MRICKSVIISLAIIAFLAGLQAAACAEERFGPWVYYSPYYFPPENGCLGYLLSPEDYLPRYESPNPPKPCYGGDCPFPGMPVPPPRMARHVPRGAQIAVPRAVASPPAAASQSQFGSSSGPMSQSRAVVPNGPRPVNHPGPQQRIMPPPANPNQAR